jgi:ketosteroid isomerase-like protein
MSRENVALIERMLGEVQENPSALYEILDDDVHWDATALEIPDAGAIHHGPAGVREFFRRWVGTFEDWGFEADEVIDAEGSVVVHIHQWGRGKGSGVEVEGRFWQVWTIRDGKVIRATHHSSKSEALEAVGLRE